MTFDTWAASHTIGNYLVHHGGKKWYFIATDNALGKSMGSRRNLGDQRGAHGSRIGQCSHQQRGLCVVHPQADGSGADVIAFATAGGDTVNLISNRRNSG